MKAYRLFILISGLAALCLQPACAEPLRERRPNIILVMTDDQGMGDLSCMGNSILRTPHLDQFYAQSTRFTDFQVSPTCAPTRSAMMSGRPPFEVGVTHTILQRERMALDVVTFPQALQAAGYRTGLFGKWHLGDEEAYLPQNRGFDEVLMHGAGGIGQFGFGDFKANTENTYFDNVLLHNDTIVKTKGFCTDVFFRAALGWIKKEEETDAPYFAYISLNAPHGPMIAPDKYKKRFLDEGYDEKTAGRYGMIENIDDNMGLLMEKLNAWNALENTLVIFMTDNGMAMPSIKIGDKKLKPFNAGLRGGKNSPWEGGTHVPAFWYWKGVLGGGVDIPALAAHLDLYRTFCDLAGAEIPESKLTPKGRSLVPLLENPKAEWPDRRLFVHRGRWGDGTRNKGDREANKYAGCAVRSQRWRLVFDLDEGELKTQLSDISADPGEQKDVAEQHPKVVEELRGAYDEWWDSLTPYLVNEGLPQVAPAQQPLTLRYDQQLAEKGIPEWEPPASASAAPDAPAIDYESFLGNHDMVWDRIPDRWEVAPYTGNGNVGFLFYQAQGEAKNVISIHAGRHDYSDHRLPHEGQQHLWIYRCRLPLGHFNLESKGDITGVDLRLDLWNAELTGTVKTSEGSYQVRGLTHSVTDVISFETEAGGGETVTISWHPDVPYSSVRKTLEDGGGPKGGTWDAMRDAPYPPPPDPVFSDADGMQFCLQALYEHRGETTTGWEVTGDAAGKQRLTASVHHSFPEKNSLATVQDNLSKARALLADDTFFRTHRKWWHDYYPQSFLTINDAEKEAFYWIQMYKLGSAMRENGPILDLMGPWYHYTFWPMVWGDLNVQLTYWTHLTANRMAVGESLANNLDKYADNLSMNVPERWKDSMALGPLFPQDCLSDDHGKTPDMLAWVLHNYWLHCAYAGDRERMRDGLFPLLRKNVNGYLNYIRENPVEADDGKIHIRQSWSPEYPGGHGQDINFTIALLSWACQTLLDLNAEHGLKDPLVPAWQNIVDNLVDFQVDENGLRIGKDIAFENPHRHYSHLLGFYPLAVITPEDPEDKKMLRTSLDHWLDVTLKSGIKVAAMPATGYTATGAASMYATLGDGEKAYHYLDFLIKHPNISPTTMYAEGNPVIESPLSFATAIHDMLLQSWGGKIRVFPGTPKIWADVAFHQFRAQGAFLVSAKKKAGATQFVTIESLIGAPCVVQVDIEQPRISIDGVEQTDISKDGNGFYTIDLKKGEEVTFATQTLSGDDFSIEALPVSEKEKNLFGLNEKTTRLPGHQFYFKEAARSDQAKMGNPPAFPGEKSDFRGYDRYTFHSGKGPVIVLCPKEAAAGKPWVWRGSFWGDKVHPFTELTVLADLKLLDAGYHVVVAGPGVALGHPSGNAAMDATYKLLTEQYGLARKPVLTGLSRETLAVYRWASANPDKVSCIYIDNGVCSLKSWPGGQLVPGSDAKGSGDATQWELAKKLYGFSSDAEALAYTGNPIDLLEPLAKAGIPLLHVCGLADAVVPYEENSAVVKARYEKLGGSIELITKEGQGHHPHGLEDSTPILEFIKRNTIPSSSTEVYVSPAGNDRDPGTKAKPVATLARARDVVRPVAGKQPVTVHVADGTYYLPETLVFTPADSGSATNPVIYRAENEGGAVLSGGSKLSLEWTPYRDGILQAKTREGLEFDQLFVDGRRQHMARYSNFDSKILPYNGHAADAFSPERAAGWMDPVGVRKLELKAIARTPEIPKLNLDVKQNRTYSRNEPADKYKAKKWLGASIAALAGKEYSAFGVSKEGGGVRLVSVPAESEAGRAGLRDGDVIQAVNGKPVMQTAELLKAVGGIPEGQTISLKAVRGQRPQTLDIPSSNQ